MRHVSYQRLLKDGDGNVIGGFFPQAFELRDGEKGLSVNWLEYFKGDAEFNKNASMQKFRDTRSVKKSSGYGMANVGVIEDVCSREGSSKVKVLSDPEPDNGAHSLIIRLPVDNLELCQALATEAFTDCLQAFTECILEKDVNP